MSYYMLESKLSNILTTVCVEILRVNKIVELLNGSAGQITVDYFEYEMLNT